MVRKLVTAALTLTLLFAVAGCTSHTAGNATTQWGNTTASGKPAGDQTPDSRGIDNGKTASGTTGVYRAGGNGRVTGYDNKNVPGSEQTKKETQDKQSATNNMKQAGDSMKQAGKDVGEAAKDAGRSVGEAAKGAMDAAESGADRMTR